MSHAPGKHPFLYLVLNELHTLLWSTWSTLCTHSTDGEVLMEQVLGGVCLIIQEEGQGKAAMKLTRCNYTLGYAGRGAQFIPLDLQTVLRISLRPNCPSSPS